MVGPLTGPDAPSFAHECTGAQALFEWQNAHGGVYGRKLKLLCKNTESTTTGNLTASEVVIGTDHAFADLAWGVNNYAAAAYFHQNGIPVVGGDDTSPVWAEQPYTNMFSFLPYDQHFPVPAYYGKIAKNAGVTKVGVFCNVNPACIGTAKTIVASIKHAGITVGYQNFTLPFGPYSFTGNVLTLKSDGINGVFLAAELTTDVALATSIKNNGLKTKIKQFYATIYTQSTLTTKTTLSALTGAYNDLDWAPIELHSSATKKMTTALTKYDSSYKGGIPSYGVTGAYIGATLFITGLKKAGRNPTRASYIKAMRGITHYTATGLLPNSISFSLSQFGKLPKTECAYYVRLQGGKFVPQPKVCGPIIPHSTTA